MMSYTCICCGEDVVQYDVGGAIHRCAVLFRTIMPEYLYGIDHALRISQDAEGQPTFSPEAIHLIMAAVRRYLR
jgi:hypothetical protein